MDKQITKTRSAITGVIGFWVGSMLGNIFTYLIAISGIVGWMVGFIPQDQILVRLLFAIVLAFLTVGLGGAAAGVFNGWVLNRIDTGGDRRHYLVGAGYAYFVVHGILLLPILLLISLLGLYNNGPRIQPQAYLLLFSLLGLIYGLIISLTSHSQFQTDLGNSAGSCCWLHSGRCFAGSLLMAGRPPLLRVGPPAGDPAFNFHVIADQHTCWSFDWAGLSSSGTKKGKFRRQRLEAGALATGCCDWGFPGDPFCCSRFYPRRTKFFDC